jgi:ATP-dependent RNA helicase SUPV3L1/SUV3
VVLGALSPRTRNAQVALYQAGEVDYLVATDAIGMGLNMDVDHVAFARLAKFDGQRPRRLTAQEIGQIAGRAGRNMAHGTFGVTGSVGELDPELVESVESHRFDPLTLLMWRNTDLDFRSGQALLASLDAPPPYGCLRRVRQADDHHALATLLRESEAAKKAKGRAAIGLLWDVCQIPDFRKVMSDQHAHLLSQIYGHLSGPGRLPADWVDGQVSRLDKTEGDIDTLVSRIAHVRTWTYVTHRPDWIAEPLDWQERTRALEDRLSDALHERLTQRFIDRRAAGLVRSLASGDALLAGVRVDGEVLVEGHPVGRLDGFRFAADATALGADAKPVLTAARRALRSEIARRVTLLEQAEDREIALTPIGEIAWKGAPVARLAPGSHALRPRVAALDSDLLLSGEAERVRKAACAWLDRELTRVFPMAAALRDGALTGPARGLAFQLAEALMPLERSGLEPLLADVSRADAARLRRLGVVAGTAWVFLRELTKPRAVALRAALWRAEHSVWGALPLPPPGRVSLAVDSGADLSAGADYWRAIGYPVVGPRAIRVDMLDRLAQRLERGAVDGAMNFDPTIAPALGCGREEADAVLAALGWAREEGEAGPVYRRRRALSPRAGGSPTRKVSSPFAVLKQLAVAE